MADPTSSVAPPEAIAESPSSHDAAEAPDRFRSVFQLVGSIVAPTTLLTALLFYFGQAHAYWFFYHFGIDISLLGLTTQDYVMRSVDALFVPLSFSLCLGLLLLLARSILTIRMFSGPAAGRRLRISAIATAIAGLVLFLIGMAGFLLKSLRGTFLLAYPLSLGGGALLLLLALRLHGRSRNSSGGPRDVRSLSFLEAAAAFLLVAVSLFWAATNYAAEVGESRAQQYELEYTSYPDAVLYSKDRLHLDAPGVEETPCSDQGGGYRFRYRGLRLILRSAGQYFLLPEGWSRRDGVAMVVPEGDSVRLQFVLGQDQSNRTAVSC